MIMFVPLFAIFMGIVGGAAISSILMERYLPQQCQDATLQNIVLFATMTFGALVGGACGMMALQSLLPDL